MAPVTDPQGARVTVPTLVVTGGPLDGTAYPIPVTTKEIVLGSNMDADVQILLGNVEPFHARLTVGTSGLLIEDAGSATGTFVNGEKVEGEHFLQEGDRICLGPPGAKGSAKLLVLLPGSPAPPDSRGKSPAPPPGSSYAAEDVPVPELETSDAEATPLFVDGEQPPLAFAEDEVSTATPEIDLAAEAENLVEDDSLGPPLEELEVTPQEDDDSLFSAPLPPAPESAHPAAPPPPPHSAAPLPAPRPAAAPPPPPPPPPPPAPAHVDRLTAPPLPPRPEAARPEYETELPSIPVERPAEPAPMPRLSPQRPAAKPKARAVRRPARRSLSLPVLPIAGGAAALAAVVGLGWLFLRAPRPQLASVTPTRVEAGQPVSLAGGSFAPEPGGNTVLFGDQRGIVTAASKSELKVVVPEALAAGDVPVVVETKGGRSKPVTLKVFRGASVKSLEPDVALPGATIRIRGENLAGQPLAVQMGGAAAQVVEASADSIRAVVPPLGLPEGQKVPVVVQVGAYATKPVDLLIGRLPLVIEVDPKSGSLGERVLIRGRGFEATPAGNTVTFGGQPALVLTASAAEIAVVVPASAGDSIQPEAQVVVTAGGRASTSPVTFVMARVPTSSFIPRFYAAPVTEYPGEGLAFVSTELGPVLLLGGRGDNPSTAERAVKVAVALNALVAGAAAKPTSFEYRERPEPSVGVVGNVSAFLVPTAEDAAAYSKPWEGGHGGGRRVGPPAVARQWAAILQDYFGLFLYRQRPLQMLALSARGRVLSEIYAESARRTPGGTGVSTSLVLPTPTTMAAALRQMALVVSGEGARAAVAIEGRWEGTIEDPDSGSRPVQVRLRVDGARLSGTFTAWAGEIELTSPLRDVSFDRGNVRFTSDLKGTAYQFQGTLEGNTIRGTIERKGKPSVSFSLQYQE
jgi:hypothetical protein